MKDYRIRSEYNKRRSVDYELARAAESEKLEGLTDCELEVEYLKLELSDVHKRVSFMKDEIREISRVLNLKRTENPEKYNIYRMMSVVAFLISITLMVVFLW